MKIELSKREIEVITEFMNLGITFLVTHGQTTKELDDTKEIINVNELMERLKENIK